MCCCEQQQQPGKISSVGVVAGGDRLHRIHFLHSPTHAQRGVELRLELRLRLELVLGLWLVLKQQILLMLELVLTKALELMPREAHT